MERSINAGPLQVPGLARVVKEALPAELDAATLVALLRALCADDGEEASDMLRGKEGDWLATRAAPVLLLSSPQWRDFTRDHPAEAVDMTVKIALHRSRRDKVGTYAMRKGRRYDRFGIGRKKIRA